MAISSVKYSRARRDHITLITTPCLRKAPPDDQHEAYCRHFREVQTLTCRWDLRVTLSGAVRQAVLEAMSMLAPVAAEIVTDRADPRVHELRAGAMNLKDSYSGKVEIQGPRVCFLYLPRATAGHRGGAAL